MPAGMGIEFPFPFPFGFKGEALALLYSVSEVPRNPFRKFLYPF
jgi:hypothetical protein